MAREFSKQLTGAQVVAPYDAISPTCSNDVVLGVDSNAEKAALAGQDLGLQGPCVSVPDVDVTVCAC